VRLQEQCFQILRRLLQGNGAIVTREELRRTLWSEDTFVDFDTGLNTAIKRLRESLGDSADVPVFIETIPRRGYRFIAPVTGPGAELEADGAGAPNVGAVELALEPRALHPLKARVAAGSLRKRVLAGHIGLVLAGVLTGALAMWVAAPLPEPKITGFTQLSASGQIKGKIVSDGARIYFNESGLNQVDLLQVSTSGGEASVLDSGIPGAGINDISVDGTKLLVSGIFKCCDQRPVLRIRDIASGVERKLGIEAPYGAVWTPDGNILVSRGSEVWLAGPDGSSPHKLFSVPGAASEFAFSPDRLRLRFTVSAPMSQGATLWEAKADGSNAHPLRLRGRTPAQECCGVWTPDGKYFVFQALDEGRSQIWMQREGRSFWHPRAGEPVQLTSGPLQFASPSVNWDGKKLFVAGSQRRAELVRYDKSTGTFVPYLGGTSVGDLEFSHDGTAVVYAKYPERTLWKSAADGSGRTPLTSVPMEAGLAHWSPDDRRIAFSASRPGQPANIYVVSTEGGPAQRVTFGSVGDLDPSWSPDGKKLVFGENAPASEESESAEETRVSIKILDLETNRLSEVPGSRGVCCPRWSPDGRYLAAADGLYTKLMLYDLTAQKWSVVADGIGAIGYIHWAPDSKSLSFDTLFTDDPYYYRVRIPGGPLEKVASLKTVNRFWGRWGSWTGMAPDGSPLFLRDVSNEELYSFDLKLP
jgi:Tol biopolymer transport system component/DNA-binding winged helix-turn-helix (wHTH) protein